MADTFDDIPDNADLGVMFTYTKLTKDEAKLLTAICLHFSEILNREENEGAFLLIDKLCHIILHADLNELTAILDLMDYLESTREGREKLTEKIEKIVTERAARKNREKYH
jgi:hypothetical protein